MDGLASFAHDPILPILDDGDFYIGESADGTAMQVARNTNSADQETNESLQSVFGDSYHPDRKFSVGSQSENNNSTGYQSDRRRRIDIPTTSLSSELRREQDEEMQLLNSLEDFQSHMRSRVNSGSQFAELGANHAHAMAVYSDLASIEKERLAHYTSHSGMGMHPQQQFNPSHVGSAHNRQQDFESQESYWVHQQNTADHLNQDQSIGLMQQMSSNAIDLQQSQHILLNQPPLQSREVEHQPAPVRSHNSGRGVSTSVSGASSTSGDAFITELSDDESDDHASGENRSKKQRIENPQPQHLLSMAPSPAAVSYAARNQHLPGWMNAGVRVTQQINNSRAATVTVHPGATLSDYHPPPKKPPPTSVASAPKIKQHKPNMLDIPEDYTSTWDAPLPSHLYRRPQGRRRYELSLVNVKEFTITGLPISWEGPPSSLAGLRKKIKELSKEHGGATYDRAKDGTDGRWRIPIVSKGYFVVVKDVS